MTKTNEGDKVDDPNPKIEFAKEKKWYYKTIQKFVYLLKREKTRLNKLRSLTTKVISK